MLNLTVMIFRFLLFGERVSGAKSGDWEKRTFHLRWNIIINILWSFEGIIERANRNRSIFIWIEWKVLRISSTFLCCYIWMNFVACAMTPVSWFSISRDFCLTFHIDCSIVILQLTHPSSSELMCIVHSTSFHSKTGFFETDKGKHLERKYSSSSSRVWVVMRLFNCTCVVVVVVICSYTNFINRCSVGLMKSKGKKNVNVLKELY